MNWKKTLLISLLILLGGGAVTALIFSTEPTAKRGGATRETAMLVDVEEVQVGTYHPAISAMGTVKPSQDITLSPRVSGQIVSRSSSFTPGGFVEKGETLLQIDPSDYKNALQQRKSELQQAESDLKIEMGRQTVARQDYQLLNDSVAQERKDLILRRPQLSAAKSRVESARTAVKQARIELQRTTIKAPFDAQIVSRNVNIGSQVSPGDNLGRMVGVDTFWVEATVPLSKVRWLTFPDGNQGRGSVVKVVDRTAWNEGEFREGYLYKLVGALEQQTRMARVLVNVPDPQNYQTENSSQPSLMMGAFVEANIRARRLSDVIRLNRDYIRKNDSVWLLVDKKLQIQPVDIAFRDARYAYISDGLNEKDLVVTTNLSTVTEGAPLRLQSTVNPVEQDTLTNGHL